MLQLANNWVYWGDSLEASAPSSFDLIRYSKWRFHAHGYLQPGYQVYFDQTLHGISSLKTAICS
jgi:hypothetical protein